jgi:hypothetical protein
VVIGGSVWPACMTFQRSTIVDCPRTVKVTTYDFAVVEVFTLKSADRATAPLLHCTVFEKPAIVGLDDQLQSLALRTATRKVSEPPDARRVFVAAPAWTTATAPRQSATLAKLTKILRFIGPL